MTSQPRRPVQCCQPTHLQPGRCSRPQPCRLRAPHQPVLGVRRMPGACTRAPCMSCTRSPWRSGKNAKLHLAPCQSVNEDPGGTLPASPSTAAQPSGSSRCSSAKLSSETNRKPPEPLPRLARRPLSCLTSAPLSLSAASRRRLSCSVTMPRSAGDRAWPFDTRIQLPRSVCTPAPAMLSVKLDEPGAEARQSRILEHPRRARVSAPACSCAPARATESAATPAAASSARPRMSCAQQSMRRMRSRGGSGASSSGGAGRER